MIKIIIVFVILYAAIIGGFVFMTPVMDTIHNIAVENIESLDMPKYEKARAIQHEDYIINIFHALPFVLLGILTTCGFVYVLKREE